MSGRGAAGCPCFDTKMEELQHQLAEAVTRNEGVESVAFVGFSEQPHAVAKRLAEHFGAFRSRSTSATSTPSSGRKASKEGVWQLLNYI